MTRMTRKKKQKTAPPAKSAVKIPAISNLPSSIFCPSALCSLWLNPILSAAPNIGANFVHLFAEVKKPDLSEWSTEPTRFRKPVVGIAAKLSEELSQLSHVPDFDSAGFQGEVQRVGVRGYADG